MVYPYLVGQNPSRGIVGIQKGKNPINQQVPSPATLQTETQSPANDGKFSFREALKNFGKGVISPVTSIFSSPKNFLISAAMVLGSVGLLAATGGAAAPALLTLGLGFGVFQLGKGAYQLATAKNGDEAERAFYNLGSGSSAIALSGIGAKANLKDSKLCNLSSKKINKLSSPEAVVENIKATPKSVKQSVKRFGKPKAPKRSYKKIGLAIVGGGTLVGIGYLKYAQLKAAVEIPAAGSAETLSTILFHKFYKTKFKYSARSLERIAC